MELRIITPDEAFLKEVSFNNEEIKQELTLRLEKYKGLVYTDDTMKLAKTDRATLNKFKEALEAKRKEIKKICLAPYEAFEFKVKEILAMVEVPIFEIDKQVKAFEEEQKDEKKAIIEGVYNELIVDLFEILPLTRMWNEKWLNATYKLSTITEEISDTCARVRNDLQVIETLEGEFTMQTKDKYLLTLDLSAALAEKARLEASAKKIKEFDAEQHRKKMEEADRKIQEQKERDLKRSTTPVVTGEVIAVHSAVVVDSSAIANEPELEQIDFRVWVNAEQKQLLKEFLKTNNIKFGRPE